MFWVMGVCLCLHCFQSLYNKYSQLSIWQRLKLFISFESHLLLSWLIKLLLFDSRSVKHRLLHLKYNIQQVQTNFTRLQGWHFWSWFHQSYWWDYHQYKGNQIISFWYNCVNYDGYRKYFLPYFKAILALSCRVKKSSRLCSFDVHLNT